MYSGEQQGAAGSSGEQQGGAGSSGEQQGAAGLLLHSEASSLMSRLQLPQRNRSVPCTVSPASVAQFKLEKQQESRNESQPKQRHCRTCVEQVTRSSGMRQPVLTMMETGSE